MNTPIYNAQFLAIDFRMLDNPEFGAFMKTSAFAVYLQLRRYIWRSRKKRHHLPKVNELYQAGYLVAAVEQSFLAEKLGIRETSHISRHISDLCRMGILRRVSTGRQSIYILGKWEDRSVQQDGSYVIELFLLEQHFGVEYQPQIVPEDGSNVLQHKSDLSMSDKSGLLPTDKSALSANDRPDMPLSDIPEMSQTTSYKYQNKKRNKQLQPEEEEKVKLLLSFQLSGKEKRRIRDEYSLSRIQEVVSYYQKHRERIENPTGWIVAALKGDYEFDTVQKRATQRIEAARKREMREANQKEREQEVREEERKLIQHWIEENSADFESFLDEERRRLSGSSLAQSEVFIRSRARVRVRGLLGLSQDSAAVH
jgi:hypothetical protein